MNSIKRIPLVALLVLAACKKDPPAPEPSASSAPPVTAASASSAAAGGDGGAPKTAAAGSPSSWSVKYTLTPATMYIPDSKDWSNTKFKNEESKYLGEGTISLTIAADGRVTGVSEGGPLGAALLDGFFDGTNLSAVIRRKDPTDDGLTGTLAGVVKGGSLEGGLKLAESNAAVVREAKITGTKS